MSTTYLVSTSTLLPRYPLVCHACKASLKLAPTALMCLGLNAGTGSCPECKKRFRLQIDDKNERMITTSYEDWLKLVGGER